MKISSPIVTSYHEASHAVAEYHIAGRRDWSESVVSIVQNGNDFGRFIGGPPTVTDLICNDIPLKMDENTRTHVRQFVVNDLIVKAAGIAGEHRYFYLKKNKKSYVTSMVIGGHDDDERMKKLASFIHPTDKARASLLTYEAISKAAKCVKVQWQQVESLAVELQSRLTITGWDIPSAMHIAVNIP